MIEVEIGAMLVKPRNTNIDSCHQKVGMFLPRVSEGTWLC